MQWRAPRDVEQGKRAQPATQPLPTLHPTSCSILDLHSPPPLSPPSPPHTLRPTLAHTCRASFSTSTSSPTCCGRRPATPLSVGAGAAGGLGCRLRLHACVHPAPREAQGKAQAHHTARVQLTGLTGPGQWWWGRCGAEYVPVPSPPATPLHCPWLCSSSHTPHTTCSAAPPAAGYL